MVNALAAKPVEQLLLHTGHHDDDAMPDVFFRELARPDISLGVGSGSHATQTAAVMTALEELLTSRRSALVVYGDVNLTVAAALVSAKLGFRHPGTSPRPGSSIIPGPCVGPPPAI